jgi:hypothetical protein
MDGKFIRMHFGPIHFQSRIVPFIENNLETLDKHIILSDNSELFKNYNNNLTVLDLDNCRKNHEWSNSLEINFNEKDPILYGLNFKKKYINSGNVLPLNVLRFTFPFLYENNILNVTYIGNNTFVTNKKELLNDYFNSIPKGTFLVPFMGNGEAKESHICSLIKEKLKIKFPELVIPDNDYYIDGYYFSFHFKNKEELLKFYEIWDYCVFLLITFNYQNYALYNHGYSIFEQIITLVMSIFNLNYDYKCEPYLKYWNHSTLGYHISLPHDSWYYTTGWGHTKFSSIINDGDILTVSDGIKKYGIYFDEYLMNTCTHLTYEIKEDNIIIKHKNI